MREVSEYRDQNVYGNTLRKRTELATPARTYQSPLGTGGKQMGAF